MTIDELLVVFFCVCFTCSSAGVAKINVTTGRICSSNYSSINF